MELKCESKKDVCRCCLSEGVLKNLYECYVWGDMRVVYSDLLLESFGVELNPLPKIHRLALNTICEECIQKLKDAYNFKLQVLKCDAEFKDLYENSSKNDEIITTVKAENESNSAIHDSILSDDDKFNYVNISDVRDILDDNAERKILDDKDEVRSDDKKVFNDNDEIGLDNIKVFDDDDETISEFDKDDEDTTLEDDFFNDTKTDDDDLLNDEIAILDDRQTQNVCLSSKTSLHRNDNKTRQITVVNAPVKKVKSKTVFLDTITDVTEDTPKIGKKMKCRPIPVINAPNRRPPINDDKRSDVLSRQGLLSIVPLLLRKDIQIRRITANNALNKNIPFHKVNVSETKQGLDSNNTAASQSMNDPHINTKKPNKRKIIPLVTTKLVSKRITIAKDASTENQGIRIKISKPRDPVVIKKGVDFVVNNNTYECCKCGRTSRTLDYIRAHIKLDHFKIFRYKCPRCPLTFPTESHSVNHKMTEHHIDDRVTCNACNKKFNTQKHLNKHLKSYHKLGVQEKCTKCDFVGDSKRLKRHSISHKKVKDCLCTLCGKSFKDKIYLRIHLRIHAGDKRNVCKVCGQDFVQYSSLSYHMKRHHPDKL